MSSAERLTKTYYQKQITRNLAAAAQIRTRSEVANGRVIPEAADIPIHGGRRIEATVMFLDICKFSSRPSSTAADQENLLRILSLFFTEMIRIAEDFGGVLEKNTGDGLMAYFVKEPNDPASAQQKAVAAALTMFTAAAQIVNPLIAGSGLRPIDFRICLDHGPITVAKVGAARGFNGVVAIGATANIASKMLAVADANSLLIGTTVISGLPSEWVRNYVQLKSAETGWEFTDTGAPYAFWILCRQVDGANAMTESQHTAAAIPLGDIPQAIQDAATISVPQSGSSELTQLGSFDLQEHHLAFAEFQEDYVRNYIALADTKAAWAFTISSGVLAYLLSEDDIRSVLLTPAWEAHFVLAISTSVLLALSAIFAFRVIAPRLSSPSREGIVFFGAVAAYPTATAYLSAVGSKSASEITEIRLKHCYDVSKVCSGKYASLKKAIWLGLPALGGALTVILAR